LFNIVIRDVDISGIIFYKQQAPGLTFRVLWNLVLWSLRARKMLWNLIMRLWPMRTKGGKIPSESQYHFERV
jgi:hypothetical protein